MKMAVLLPTVAMLIFSSNVLWGLEKREYLVDPNFLPSRTMMFGGPGESEDFHPPASDDAESCRRVIEFLGAPFVEGASLSFNTNTMVMTVINIPESLVLIDKMLCPEPRFFVEHEYGGILKLLNERFLWEDYRKDLQVYRFTWDCTVMGRGCIRLTVPPSGRPTVCAKFIRVQKNELGTRVNEIARDNVALGKSVAVPQDRTAEFLAYVDKSRFYDLVTGNIWDGQTLGFPLRFLLEGITPTRYHAVQREFRHYEGADNSQYEMCLRLLQLAGMEFDLVEGVIPKMSRQPVREDLSASGATNRPLGTLTND